MNRAQTFIFFAILYSLIICVYVFIYHKKKRQKTALIFAVISLVFVTSGFVFILPFQCWRTVIDEKESPVHIKKINNKNYIVCDDGTKYEYTAMNSQMTKQSTLYRNDKHHSNVKVDVTYKYSYRIWWLIPSYSLSYGTDIYLDADAYYEKFCVQLPYK